MYQKHLSLQDCGIKMEGERGHFAGYASVFGAVDSMGDTILKGAYAETLKNYGLPKMFVQHDTRALPVGKWLSAVEDDHGLKVEGEFTPGMGRADEAHAALRHGTVDGLSIGFYLKKTDFDDHAEGRVIHTVSRLAEVSIVTYPAETGARVDLASVKTEEIERLETIRDFECFLRDAGGMSKGLTEALVSRAKVVFGRGEPAADLMDAKATSELERIFRSAADDMAGLSTVFSRKLKT